MIIEGSTSVMVVQFEDGKYSVQIDSMFGEKQTTWTVAARLDTHAEALKLAKEIGQNIHDTLAAMPAVTSLKDLTPVVH